MNPSHGNTVPQLLELVAKWVIAGALICYGLAVLAAGLLSYDIVYVFGAPRDSVTKLQQFSLILGVLSIGLGAVILAPIKYRKSLTLAVAIATPVAIIAFSHTNEHRYNREYMNDDQVGQMQVAYFRYSGYGAVNTGELQRLNEELLGHVKEKVRNAKENIYSLPIKNRFEKGMNDANREIEYFMKKQKEAEQGRR